MGKLPIAPSLLLHGLEQCPEAAVPGPQPGPGYFPVAEARENLVDQHDLNQERLFRSHPSTRVLAH